MGYSEVMPEGNSFGPMSPEDEISQAMDMAAGHPAMQPEPNSFQIQYDPFATAQQMFEEQMQYMDAPFMMSNMGPMQGPAPGM